MSRYFVLLPAPGAEWAQLPEPEHEKGMRSHGQLHQDLADGGHRLIAVSPLEPSAQATSMRPDGQGGAVVTDGPSTESVEQIVGFYLVESGRRIGSAPLAGADTATTIRHVGGTATVTDGPFVESAEQVGGYYDVELPSLDAAIAAGRLLPASYALEIRPTVTIDGYDGA